MRPADRIAAITRCARALAANRVWSDIDFILSQFHLPTTDRWTAPDGQEDRAKFFYVRDMLAVSDALDQDIEALDEYLSGDVAADPDDEPWASGRFRLFLTHVAARKGDATNLKRALAVYGVDAFVAHEDIRPGAEWQRKIAAALHSCDALAGLLHGGVRESDWCDQEVGVVIGHGRPVVPISIDLVPYGFLGAVQAIHAKGRTPKAVAADIVTLLLDDKRTSAAMIEALVRQLSNADSYGHANLVAALLADHADLVDRDQLARIRAAQKSNRQVEGAWEVNRAISEIAERLGPVATTVPAPNYDDFGEEPF